MARPYSKRTVDQAEELLLVKVSEVCLLKDAADAIGLPTHTTAFRLALEAEDAVYGALPFNSFDDVCVEAAALIRSGWMIGDPIELLLPVETESTTEAAEEPLREDEKAFFVQDHLADAAAPEAAFVQPLQVATPSGTEPYVRDPSRPEAGTVIDLEPVEYVADTYSNGDYGADS